MYLMEGVLAMIVEFNCFAVHYTVDICLLLLGMALLESSLV